MRTLIIVTLLLTAFSPHHAPAQKPQTLYLIGGQILDNSGNPACGVRVCAFAEDFDLGRPNMRLPCSLSDRQGHFSIAVGEHGRYKLFTDQIQNGYWPQNQPFFRDPSLEIPEVIVNDTPRVPITIYQPAKHGILVGRSVDTRTGLPVDNVEFVLCLVASPQICRVTNSKRADGEFRIPAPFVPFTFKARSRGYRDWFGPRGEEQFPMSVSSASTTQLNILLIRQRDDGSLPLTEMEKQPGIHLPAPSQVAPEEGATYNHFPRSTKLEWSAVDGAVSYSVEIDYCQGAQQKRECVDPQPFNVRSKPPMEGITATEYQFSFIGAQPGRWRVWAIDSNGREGFKSPWRTFFYLK
ncbi:MAG TPA: hypothetical protein VJU84_03610 [Pyrinomonadaceae bacterium]|nr:hypothetical protein [Pyrinomonadaceae bacterium]